MQKAETEQCKNCKTDFQIEPDDFSFYEKVSVPPPTLCPLCRLQRRLLFRNERTFYKRKCDLCDKAIVATYPEDAPFPVYCQKCWWSDDWDPLEYGRDYDFSRPFFEQFQELFYSVPMISIMNDDGIASTNSEYAYDWAFSKNCYMSVCGWHVENGLYSYHINYAKDIMDCFHVEESELMYESLNCQKCYRSSHCTHCIDCRDCFGGFDLRNCSDCLFSVGLRNKKFCIFNEQYSEEEYKKKKAEMGFGSHRFLEENKKRFEELVRSFPHKYALIHKSVATTGNVLRNCKNVHDSFYQSSMENCRFMIVGDEGKDTYDCTNTGKPNLCYNSVTPDNTYMGRMTIYCWKCSHIDYSNNCHGSEYLFGCSGMKKGSHSILNKKYSREEYENLKERIISNMKETGEWGEFFPADVSPHAYNETAAQEWFPLEEKEARNQGYDWKEIEQQSYEITMLASEVPQSIEQTDDDILEQIIGCGHEGKCNEKCTTAFKVTPYELNLYRKIDVPIPKLCPNCRHYARLARRNPVQLWNRQCMCDYSVYENLTKHDHHLKGRCSNTFETSYAPDRKEIVYCEACYNAEVA